MIKNIYLSKQEQMVFNVISSADMAYTDEMEDIFPILKPHQINKICYSLSSKGYLYRLKKGIYLVQKKPSQFPAIKNPYKIASALFKGYIGFSTALRLYDLIDYEPFTIFIVTENKSIEKIIGEYTFKAVAMGGKARGMTHYKDVYISTIAKTFFDCFYKPQYGGGYSTITKALHDADVDWDEFLDYFDVASSSLCQRTGYVLEVLSQAAGKIPEEVLQYFRTRIKNNTKLLPSAGGKGHYIKRWMLLDNLGKENILSWWYHG